MLQYVKNWIRNALFDFENNYYVNFFVENSNWNSFEPNEDELSRWSVIKEFINQIELHKSTTILDVGCGRGWLANKLKPYGSVTAIDPVPGVIEYAKQLYKNIDFYCRKPNQLLREKGQEQFDIIVCSEVLEHVFFKKNFINNLKKMLKTNGYLILSTPRLELQENWIKTQSQPSQPIERWISTDSLINLFKKLNLQIIQHKTTYVENIYQIYLVQKSL